MPKIPSGFLLAIFLTALITDVGAQQESHAASYQERQCMTRGWQHFEVGIDGMTRQLLWKGPERSWSKGAIIVMHGGGGHYFQWCIANAPIVAPQVRFTDLALARGFAVFLLDSSDQVTDNQGRVCGKVWDDEVRDRPNLDLPFIGEVIQGIIPRLRPPESRREIFMTGLSSGGYMTVRAATHFDNLITAFAPISSGDPYGWHRICEKGMTRRETVHGAGFDNETGRQIIEIDACRASSYPNEKQWDSANPAAKPTFQIFHHQFDGISDLSCAEKVRKLLLQHGYPEVPPLLLRNSERRSLENHLWQDEYNHAVIEFFTSRLRK